MFDEADVQRGARKQRARKDGNQLNERRHLRR
jgi:hypothetical protein